jgi:hypothetical protein
MGETKQRSFRLTEELLEQLNTEANVRNISISALAELLLAQGLTKKEAEAQPGPGADLTELKQELTVLRSEQKALGEVLSFFVYQWLCNTPALPDAVRADALAQGSARYKKFLELVLSNLKRGEFSLKELYTR